MKKKALFQRNQRLGIPLSGLLLTLLMLPAVAEQRQVLHGHVPRLAAQVQPIGLLPATQKLSLAVGLPLRHQEEFESLLRAIYDPGSPQYRHFLTPQEIAARFGPAKEDYAAVMAFMQTNGFTVTGSQADRTLLRVSGAVADIERTFHLNMLLYPHPSELRTFYAPDVEPSLDLEVPVLGISGLNNTILPTPGGHSGTPLDQSAGVSPGAGSGPGGAFWGNDYRAAYAPGVTLTGAGQAIGLLELDGYYTNDIAAYERSAGLPNVPIRRVLLDGASGTPDSESDWVGEVSLDMEMAISMAPGLSELIVYEAPNCCYYWVDILKQMQQDNAAKQLSCSWLFDYDDPNAEPIYKEFAMQGQSFLQCSGDYVAFYNGVSQWTADTNVTLVGGTMLTVTGQGGPWASERAWNNGDGTHGSGGGISSSYMGGFSIPSWQEGISMATNGGSTTERNVPDVAMVAYDGWVIWNNGSAGWWWGTSIAAPLWAGFTALVNQQAAAHGQLPVGFLNPAVYAIGKGPWYASCFHDITNGNNTNTHSSGLFEAVAGYDLCTGWGTPTGSNLINVLSLAVPITMEVSQTSGQVTVRWNAIPGQRYQLQYSTNLEGGNWQTLASLTATNSPVTQTDSSHTNALRFYRAVLTP